MSNIPEEICREILLRSPVESLILCKSVCKNWYALITSSDFIKLHHNLVIQKNNPILVLKGEGKFPPYSIDYDSLSSSSIVKADTIDIDYPFKSLDYDVNFKSSCNGLIFINLYNGHKSFFCFWNPATREYKKIPPKLPTSGNTCMYGFGYDHKTNDYKLVIGTKIEHHGSKDSTLVQVYSLASNSWKRGQTIPYGGYHYNQEFGLLVNGNLHWLAPDVKNNILLLSLDIADENFKELQLPKEILEKSRHPEMIMGVLEGCFSVLFSSYVNDLSNRYEVWEMLDYGVQESWNRRYIITHESFEIMDSYLASTDMWSFENGKIIFLSFGDLLLYDTENGCVRDLKTHDTILRGGVSYFESLVSLESGSYVGGEGRSEESRGEQNRQTMEYIPWFKEHKQWTKLTNYVPRST